MTLTRQKRLTNQDLKNYFQSIYTTKLERAGFVQRSEHPFYFCLPSEAWQCEGYVDGPLTFVKVETENLCFTGWSKFDNTGRYHEITGICNALQKAIEKYVKYQCEVAEEELKNSKWGTGEDLWEELPPPSPQEVTLEVQTDRSAERPS